MINYIDELDEKHAIDFRGVSKEQVRGLKAGTQIRASR